MGIGDVVDVVDGLFQVVLLVLDSKYGVLVVEVVKEDVVLSHQ